LGLCCVVVHQSADRERILCHPLMGHVSPCTHHRCDLLS
jgi:hypothetical protein